MSDLISRQVVISAICSAYGKIDCDKMDKCEKLQLPTANTSETPNSSDTISRQAAIDDVHVRCNCDKDGHYIGYVANFTCVCDEWEVTP